MGIKKISGLGFFDGGCLLGIVYGQHHAQRGDGKTHVREVEGVRRWWTFTHGRPVLQEHQILFHIIVQIQGDDFETAL